VARHELSLQCSSFFECGVRRDGDEGVELGILLRDAVQAMLYDVDRGYRSHADEATERRDGVGMHMTSLGVRRRGWHGATDLRSEDGDRGTGRRREAPRRRYPISRRRDCRCKLFGRRTVRGRCRLSTTRASCPCFRQVLSPIKGRVYRIMLSTGPRAEPRPLAPWMAEEFLAHIDRARATVNPWSPWAARSTDLASATRDARVVRSSAGGGVWPRPRHRRRASPTRLRILGAGRAAREWITTASNVPSRALAQRLGMRVDGVGRSGVVNKLPVSPCAAWNAGVSPAPCVPGVLSRRRRGVAESSLTRTATRRSAMAQPSSRRRHARWTADGSHLSLRWW
jgi:hypothetical protein